MLPSNILQMMALVAHGNAYLRRDDFFDENFCDYYPDNNENEKVTNNDAFKFVDKVTFVKIESDSSEFPIIANNQAEWLKQIKEDGCTLLQLSYYPLPEAIQPGDSITAYRETAGMIGGGVTWWIDAIYSDYKIQWSRKEEPTNDSTTNGGGWTVTYGSQLKKISYTYEHEKYFDVMSIFKIQKRDLKKALTNIQKFSSAQKLDSWTKVFDNALKILDGKGKSLDDFKKFKKCFPSGYFTDQFFQIAGACNAAWVFGGEGSWNDMAFDKPIIQKEYTKLSDQLYCDVVYNIAWAIDNREMIADIPYELIRSRL